MTSIASASWLTPSPADIAPEPWRLKLPGSQDWLPQRLTTWDSATDLALSRTIYLRTSAVRSTSGLTGALRIVGVWWCPGTGIGRALDIAEILPDETESSVLLEGTVAGAELSERLVLKTMLVTSSSTMASHKLAAQRPGSILWEEAFEVALEGSASRFPTETADFAAMGWPSDATWYLHWDDPDFDAPFRRAVRLYLNVKNEAVYRAVISPESEAKHRAVVSSIRFDVARSILAHGLTSSEFVEQADSWPADSVGDAIGRMLFSCFPEHAPHTVARMLDEQPERFSLILQASLHLFGDLV